MVLELQLQKLRISLVLKSFFFPLTSHDVFNSFTTGGFEVGSPPVQYPFEFKVASEEELQKAKKKKSCFQVWCSSQYTSR